MSTRVLEEVRMAFDQTVQQTTGFVENEVELYGNVRSDTSRILSSMCMVPEGIRYTINGQEAVFDTVEHVHAFLTYGVPSNLPKWVRGGVMSDFRTIFGDQAGGDMHAKHGGDMIGLIPKLIVKKERAHLRSAHGIEIKEAAPSKEECMHYDYWRPILFAKFDVPGSQAMEALVTHSGNKYLLDKDGADTEWSGRITYPVPLHGPGVDGCSCSENNGCLVQPNKCKATKEFNRLKREGARIRGTLTGNNRMGKYLMAVRCEIRLIRELQK